MDRASVLLALTVLLLVPPGASFATPQEPDLQPMTLHPHPTGGLGFVTREPAPEGWTAPRSSVLCPDDTDEANMVLSRGRPVLEDGRLTMDESLGLTGRLHAGDTSHLVWFVEVPVGAVVPVQVVATVEGFEEAWFRAEAEATLSSQSASFQETQGTVDVHRMELELESIDGTTFERRSSLVVAVTSPGCAARNHSSAAHRPTWNLSFDTPVVAYDLNHVVEPERGGPAFVAWVGSAWGPDDLLLEDLTVHAGSDATVPLTMLQEGILCHCEDDSYQYLVRWEAPAPDGAWSAETLVRSAMHPGVVVFSGASEAANEADRESPGVIAPTLLVLLAAVVSWKRP